MLARFLTSLTLVALLAESNPLIVSILMSVMTTCG